LQFSFLIENGFELAPSCRMFRLLSKRWQFRFLFVPPHFRPFGQQAGSWHPRGSCSAFIASFGPVLNRSACMSRSAGAAALVLGGGSWSIFYQLLYRKKMRTVISLISAFSLSPIMHWRFANCFNPLFIRG